MSSSALKMAYLRKKIKRLISMGMELSGSVGPRVLVYHQVLPRYQIDFSRYFSGLSVATDAFEEQLRYIKKRFLPVSVDEILLQIRENRLDPRAVCVTFDDGYRDNLLYALPLLEKYRVPAALFISPGLRENPHLMWWFELEECVYRGSGGTVEVRGFNISWDGSLESKWNTVSRLNSHFKQLPYQQTLLAVERLRDHSKIVPVLPDLLSDDEVQQLATHPLITLGAHTIHHHSLAQLEMEDLRSELTESQKWISKFTGQACLHFAYPYGGRAESGIREFTAVGEQGFATAFTTVRGHLSPSTDLLNIPRIVIDGSDCMQEVRWKIGGGQEFWERVNKRDQRQF